MAKTTRKQLKEDKFLSTTAKLSLFLEEHWKQIVGIIVAVVILIGAIILYSSYVKGRNLSASRNFNEAKALYDEAQAASGTEEGAESANEKYEEAREKFQEVSQKGGNSDTISRALFYSAKCSYQLGRYDEAISIFQRFVDKYNKSMFILYVQKAMGNCYEQLGGDDNLEKAIQQYDEVIRATETHATLEAFLDKGRCYEKLEKWEEAISAYRSITDKFKQKAESAIQTRSRELIKAARAVISKYETALVGVQASDDFVKFMDEANAFEGKDQWFEALKAYDKAISVQKKHWSEGASEGEYSAVQTASNALGDYENLSESMIKNVAEGRKLEKKGDWDGASRYYNRAVIFDFLPGTDLFEKAQFRIYWINSVERSSQSSNG